MPDASVPLDAEPPVDAATPPQDLRTSPLLAAPPASGLPHAPDGTGSVTFAITKFFVGDTDPNGTRDFVNGWKNYGYDIDGVLGAANLSALCKPVNNASPSTVHAEGALGIDNAFGHLILPTLLGINASYSTRINAALASGKSTTLIDLQLLGSGGDYNPISASFYGGGDFGAQPKFDGTDRWPVLSETLVDPSDLTKGAKVSFATSYVTGNTWVSGPPANVELLLPIGFSGFGLVAVSLSHAVISMELDAPRRWATRGVISGVLSTSQLTALFRQLGGAFDPSLCSGPTIQSIIAQVAQASDVLHDGTQDPTKPCDGISIGLGFEATRVQLGPIAPPTRPTPSPCSVDMN